MNVVFLNLYVYICTYTYIHTESLYFNLHTILGVPISYISPDKHIFQVNENKGLNALKFLEDIVFLAHILPNKTLIFRNT